MSEIINYVMLCYFGIGLLYYVYFNVRHGLFKNYKLQTLFLIIAWWLFIYWETKFYLKER